MYLLDNCFMKKKILVIEDDKDILEILTHILLHEGYEIESSRDGNAVHKVKEIKPDLILCDIWVPHFKGTDICVMLKSEAATKTIPFILISTSMKLPQLAMECGADNYIQKPFQVKEVITLVKEYI